MNLLTIRQVAEQLQVSTRKVRQLAATGELVVHRIGGSLRISEDDLATYLNRCREKPQPRRSGLRYLRVR
jgi:excisionase family DNA binding protein